MSEIPEGQLTEAQAKEFYDSGAWKEMSHVNRATFQLFQERLCMPFDVFHEAITKTLQRPVYTHEFAFVDLLRKELLGEKPPPSFEEIIELIPADKRIILVKP